MSRTHGFTLALGVATLALLAALWTRVELTDDEIVILIASLVPLVYLQARGIEVRVLPEGENEPPVTVTWSLTEGFTVPLAAVVNPIAAATAAAVGGLVAVVITSRRQGGRPIRLAPTAGSMTAITLSVLGVGALVHLLLGGGPASTNYPTGSLWPVLAISIGVSALHLVGMGWNLALYASRGVPLRLGLELESLYLVPMVAVLGSILLLAYRPGDPSGVVAASLLCLLLAETLRHFFGRALQARRQDEARANLLQAVVESEDKRRAALAGRLHDGALQGVLAVKMQLDVGSLTPSGAMAPVDQQLVATQLDVVAAQLRGLMSDELRLAAAEKGLPLALERERSAFNHVFREGISLFVEPGIELSPQIELVVYQVVHEALVNAERHSEATHVAVRMWVDQDVLTVDVSDNGRGCDPKEIKTAQDTGHVGISLMRERLADIGGQLIIGGDGGSGTSVRARVRGWPRR